MKEIELALKELNLGKNDVKVYISLLKKGRLNISRIATESGVHRVNVYDALRILQREGLVSEVQIDTKKFYAASNPTQLQVVAKRKEEQIANIIPHLQQLSILSENTAKTYAGVEGVKEVLRDMLVEKKTIKAFGILKEMSDYLGEFIKTFHRERIKNKQTILQAYNDNAVERINYLNTILFSQAKYLPEELNVPATTITYGNKTAFLIWDKEPFSVVIESELMARAYEKYFEFLWGLAKN